MCAQTSNSSVVWHDLFTNNAAAAKSYYAKLGFDYSMEHATDFVWQSGSAADYPLIMAADNAHGGLVSIDAEQHSRWLAYVSVDDVELAAARAESVGGSIVREPFDVPGVGRVCVVRDFEGAEICPFKATHSYPAPRGLFVHDELITRRPEQACEFYSIVFDWKFQYQTDDLDSTQYVSDLVKVTIGDRFVHLLDRRPSVWVPSLNAELVDQSSVTFVDESNRIAMDPSGALFRLSARLFRP